MVEVKSFDGKDAMGPDMRSDRIWALAERRKTVRFGSLAVHPHASMNEPPTDVMTKGGIGTPIQISLVPASVPIVAPKLS